MRRRLLASTVLIALGAILVLGVPLAFVGTRLARNDETGRLEREGDRIAAAAARQRATGRIDADALGDLAERGHQVVVMIPGRAPLTIGAPVSGRVLRVRSGSALGPRVLVIASAEHLGDRERNVWLVIAGLSAAGLLLAVALALLQTRRLVGPLRRLSDTAQRLGAGDFSARAAHSGLPEIDAVADAQNASAVQIARLVARERAFSANVSHQMRTPLTALQLRLESIRSARGLDEAQAEAEQAIGQADRLEATIHELLALARAEQGAREHLAVNELVGWHVETWRPLFAQRGRRLGVAVAPGLAVHARRGTIGQALDVLLDNALGHCRTRADLEAAARGGQVVLTVSDDGPGVREGDRHRVFEPHVSLRGSTGLGLAVARALVESDGGTLRLVEPGSARFEIALPAP